MVRFHWHVEHGCGASIPHGGMSFHKDTAVQHISCNIEIPGEPAAQACITVPRGYLSEGKVQEVGILLGHDNPESYDGPLLTGLAVALAEAGHVVVRYLSDGTELRRQRLYEKALDVCATSPFARFVQRWVLAGVGHGARLAAIVGCRARGTVCGYVFVSYPLTESLQTVKGTVLPDSSILLLRIQAPSLFVTAAGDSRDSTEQLRKVAAQMKPATEPRLFEVAGVDGAFKSGEPLALQPETLAAVTKPIVQFVQAIGAGALDSCSVPLANPKGTAAAALSDSAAAGIKAQIQLLDTDDSLIYDAEPLGKSGDAAAAAAAANGATQQQRAAQQQQQQLLQQQLQLQVLQQQQVQQAQLAAAAAKAGINMQQAQRVAAAAAAAAGKLPINLAAAAAAAAAAGGAAAASSAPGAAPVMLPGGLQITPQMLAAAQAMQLAAAKGMRPGAQLAMPGGAAVAAAQQQAAAAAQSSKNT